MRALESDYFKDRSIGQNQAKCQCSRGKHEEKTQYICQNSSSSKKLKKQRYALETIVWA